ncbi:MAG: hypothetical protein HRU80_09795 [Ignavibacteriales bacterium]|nr:MAG: hypothetical protein HRU80_09795 [Ignavibacteriales bacterium]
MNKFKYVLSLCSVLIVSFFVSGSFYGSVHTPSGNPSKEKVYPIKGNTSQLKYYFDALKDAKNKKVRIGHWGDSIILGDILSDSFRRLLQKQFGGNGVGFVSLVPEDSPMRLSTIVTSSGDWIEASLFKRNPDRLPLGINASVFTTKSEKSWVSYDVGKYNKSIRNYNSIHLFYANGNSSGEVKFITSNGFTKTVKLESGSGIRKVSVDFPTPATSVKLEFSSCKNIYFYGVSIENSHGVYVDNFPIKGNNGIGLQDLSSEVLSDFKKLQDYKLLILNFGVNVLSPEHKEYDWYMTRMEKVIAHIQNSFPGTSILIISTGDKGVKKGGKFVSEPQIRNLLKAQEELATRTGVAFWNLFEAMGGENAIVDWVNSRPALAYKDYCHFTPEGGDKVADMLNEALMNLMNK